MILNLRVLGKNILVQFNKESNRSLGGLHLPSGAANVGTVVALGDDVSELEDGENVLLKRTISDYEKLEIAAPVSFPNHKGVLFLVVHVSEVSLVLEQR
ncbi:MAG: hypothetical protein MJH10_10890 [Epibacterium sp.]|nr:hypothetical protein [Epibacterium sp.]NQX74050.1 hypothetical protein [Epibacterium sp.]